MESCVRPGDSQNHVYEQEIHKLNEYEQEIPQIQENHAYELEMQYEMKIHKSCNSHAYELKMHKKSCVRAEDAQKVMRTS